VIVVECYNDEFLIKTLGFSRPKHEGCKGKVLEKVTKDRNPLVIGIVDEDPDSNQPSSLRDYIQKDSKSSIKLLVSKHDDRRKIVQISPFLEEWILERARQNKILPSEFSLPNDSHALHSIPNAHKRLNFQKFMRHLAERDAEMAALKVWLQGY